jgi:hypothetical protein
MTQHHIQVPFPEIPEEAPAPNPKLAVCKVERIPTRVFFIDNEREFPKLVSDAKSFCKRCPEIETCLIFALANKLPDGIYGGRTASERGRMRRKQAVIHSNQWHWKRELNAVNWDQVAHEIGLPPNWRTRLTIDPPEQMIDSDSAYFRSGDGMLGCRFKRNGCSARFDSLEACFRHAFDPTVRHIRSTKEPQ